jgi:hypothetical protein
LEDAVVDARWVNFARLLKTDPVTRGLLNLPKSDAAYARTIGISDRSVRIWKADDKFAELLEQVEPITSDDNPFAVLKTAVNYESTPDDVEDDSELNISAEEQYLQVKAKLVEGAIEGDPRYLEMYFKTYGKDFLAEEAAARASDYSSTDLADLIVEAITELDPESIVKHLRKLGWRVERRTKRDSSN